VNTWIILRAAGIGSYIALWLAVDWGLISTTSLVTKRVSKPTSILFHGVVASAGLALLVIHLGGLLIDRFVPFGPLDLLIPMHAAYRTLAVTFGVLAMYGMVLVLVTSWIRKRLGTKLWRAIHLLAIPIFTLALAHGVFAGTDSSRPWMFAIYVMTGLSTLFLLIVRGLTIGYRPPRAERPASKGTAAAEDAPVTRREVVRTP
jgi:methionine sulfoxide reductase heme-binding subunit